MIIKTISLKPLKEIKKFLRLFSRCPASGDRDILSSILKIYQKMQKKADRDNIQQ